jgi:hypothetical protein
MAVAPPTPVAPIEVPLPPKKSGNAALIVFLAAMIALAVIAVLYFRGVIGH